MEYDKEFEEVYRIVKPQCEGVFSMHDVALAVWQAARKDHYRIGEEVENILTGERAAVKAVLSFTDSITHIYPNNVRRIPAKSRIDEIAEEAKDLYMATSAGDRDRLTHIIKSAILKDREEREANR